MSVDVASCGMFCSFLASPSAALRHLMHQEKFFPFSFRGNRLIPGGEPSLHEASSSEAGGKILHLECEKMLPLRQAENTTGHQHRRTFCGHIFCKRERKKPTTSIVTLGSLDGFLVLRQEQDFLYAAFASEIYARACV